MTYLNLENYNLLIKQVECLSIVCFSSEETLIKTIFMNNYANVYYLVITNDYNIKLKDMALPPNYVRKVSVHNHMEHTLRFHVEFAQNHAVYFVDPQGHQDIEGTIDHGSYQSVDPVKKITVIDPDQDEKILSEKEFSSDTGVKILHFNIEANSTGALVWNEHQHNNE